MRIRETELPPAGQSSQSGRWPELARTADSWRYFRVWRSPNKIFWAVISVTRQFSFTCHSYESRYRPTRIRNTGKTVGLPRLPKGLSFLHSWFYADCFLIYLKTHDHNMCMVHTAMIQYIRGGADKSLARPGRKQATMTKLGIYSTYSSRSPIHFLAGCSTFSKPLKKIQKVARRTRSPRQQWPPRRTKNGDLSIVFSVQGTGGSSTGPDPKNRLGDQGNGSSGRPVYSGLQVPGEPGHCCARTRPPWWPSRGVFPSKCPSIAPDQQRWVILCVYSMALWKIINNTLPW